jgi:hypothetical protein
MTDQSLIIFSADILCKVWILNFFSKMHRPRTATKTTTKIAFSIQAWRLRSYHTWKMKDLAQRPWLIPVALVSSCWAVRPLWWLVDAYIPPVLLPVSLYRRSHSQNLNCAAAVVHRAPTYLWAKSAKGKKAKKQKQQQQQTGFAWANSFILQPYEAQSTRELVSMALATFQAKTGKALCDDIVGVTDIPKVLWKTLSVALVVIESSNSSSNNGGRVMYANVAALETVGLAADQWQQLQMTNPSRQQSTTTTATDTDTTSNNKDEQSSMLSTSLSSSPTASTLRLDLPADMRGDKTYEKGYEKTILRQHSMPNDERRHSVRLLNAHRWKIEKQVLGNDGTFVTTAVGVAYAWKEWALDDAIVCAPGGKQREMINADALQQAVEAQGKKIRIMKQEKGLGNKDLEVQEAVAELLRLKGLLVVHDQ